MTPTLPVLSYLLYQSGCKRTALGIHQVFGGSKSKLKLQANVLHIEYLSRTLRLRIFAKIMQSDIRVFDEEKNSTGALTSSISEQPQKVNAACGVTLGTNTVSVPFMPDDLAHRRRSHHSICVYLARRLYSWTFGVLVVFTICDILTSFSQYAWKLSLVGIGAYRCLSVDVLRINSYLDSVHTSHPFNRYRAITSGQSKRPKGAWCSRVISTNSMRGYSSYQNSRKSDSRRWSVTGI